MPLSSRHAPTVSHPMTLPASSRAEVGYCLNCGYEVARTGIPISEEFRCNKCFRINIYKDSMRPVSYRIA